jgi:hypothetical protein
MYELDLKNYKPEFDMPYSAEYIASFIKRCEKESDYVDYYILYGELQVIIDNVHLEEPFINNPIIQLKLDKLERKFDICQKLLYKQGY